ncbi:MAG: NAD-dependent epimerase/dehydratase family protein [Rickettsiales bacterium]|nr:NAD-dependent epimerase/dehydratase family protein [Rickettsiales bacterium]
MTILVTGASGCIGRAVLKALVRRAVPVIATARKIPHDVPTNTSIRWIPHDLAQGAEVLLAQADTPETVIHLAWESLPQYHNPAHLEHELPRQKCFLTDLVNNGVQKLVVAGTCQEYGMQSGCLSETTTPSPTTPYAQAKHALHAYLEVLQKSHAFTLIWARLFYVWGEGQPDHTLYRQLYRAARQGKATFPMSGGEQQRDYLPLEQAAEMLTLLTQHPRASGTYNICSGQPVCIRDLVSSWISAHGWTIHPELGVYPYPDYEPMVFWGDPTRLNTLWGDAGG